MQSQAQALLDTVDRFFADPNTGRQAKLEAWRVLTALRGPDSGDNRLSKKGVTAVIRLLALPRTSAINHTTRKGNAFQGAFKDEGIGYSVATQVPTVVKISSNAGQHFIAHAKKALEALGKSYRMV